MAIIWEKLETQIENGGFFATSITIYRAKVPGGWLIGIQLGASGGVTFYPDPDHKWNGNSLDYVPGM